MIEDRQHSGIDEGAAEDAGVGADKPAAGGLSIEDYEGQRVLMQDGAILSVALGDADPSFGYWTAMLPEGMPRSALLLGLGAGTLAHMLTRRFPGIRIVGVDNDSRLVEFARRHFDLTLPNLEVVIGDAFA